MSSLPMETQRRRAKSALSHNCTNIELHACLDEATVHKQQVKRHLAKNKFENHVLESAERFYKRESGLRPARSLSSFKRSSETTLPGSKVLGQPTILTLSSIDPHKFNPEDVLGVFQRKTQRVSQIKTTFEAGIEEKLSLKDRMQWLKKMIVEEKNKKAKISIRNCKLMNAAEASNHRINNLEEHSRRHNIHINELLADISKLEAEKEEQVRKNRHIRQKIEEESDQVAILTEFTSNKKRNLMIERNNLQLKKEETTVSYKQMTNQYMKMNQLKEEKAWLLNCIDLDVYNNT